MDSLPVNMQPTPHHSPFVPTRGERLLVQRRRNGWNILEAAHAYRVTAGHYAAWELGGDGAPMAYSGLSTPGEVCLIRRLRARMSIEDVAAKAALSVTNVAAMESGTAGCGELLVFWDAHAGK